MRFLPRQGVRARFDDVDLEQVDELGFDNSRDVPHMGNSLYVCLQEHDVIRFVGAAAPTIAAGQRGELALTHRGAAYRVTAVCAEAGPAPEDRDREAGERWSFVFDALERPRLTAPAKERFGVQGLGAALLLDALERAHEGERERPREGERGSER